MPATDGTAGRAALVALLRDQSPGVLATLARQVGSLQLAEDAVQDAAVRALQDERAAERAAAGPAAAGAAA